MKKVALVILMAISSVVFASDATLEVGGVKNRVTQANGSIARVNVSEGALIGGLQTETVSTTSRNQGDVSYGFPELFGVKTSIGLGAVTQTGVRSHVVYLGNIGYTYNFNDAFNAGVGVSYRNDLDKNILDKRAAGKFKFGYNLDKSTSLGASYERAYGDEKTNTYALIGTRKF